MSIIEFIIFTVVTDEFFLSINAILGIVFTHELLMIQSLQLKNLNVMQWWKWKKEVVEGSNLMLRMMK